MIPGKHGGAVHRSRNRRCLAAGASPRPHARGRGRGHSTWTDCAALPSGDAASPACSARVTDLLSRHGRQSGALPAYAGDREVRAIAVAFSATSCMAQRTAAKDCGGASGPFSRTLASKADLAKAPDQLGPVATPLYPHGMATEATVSGGLRSRGGISDLMTATNALEEMPSLTPLNGVRLH